MTGEGELRPRLFYSHPACSHMMAWIVTSLPGFKEMSALFSEEDGIFIGFKPNKKEDWIYTIEMGQKHLQVETCSRCRSFAESLYETASAMSDVKTVGGDLT